MTRQSYAIRLEGVEAFDLPLTVLRDLGALFAEGAQRAARLAVEGRSTAHGTVPAWTSAVADLRVVAFAPGSLTLGIEAPRLLDAAPDVFQPSFLFGRAPESDATALDLLLDALDDVVNERRDSDRLDVGMLEVLVQSGGLFARGATRLTVERRGRPSTTCDATILAKARCLADETPASRVVRVRGIVDIRTVSTRALAIRFEEGAVLRGFAETIPIEHLHALNGHDVVVDGRTTYRPSGDPLRIEVDDIAAATARDRIWSAWPRIERSPLRARASGFEDGIAASFGAWPGDETDEEFERLLAPSDASRR